ncbi:MAG TPA: SAM-dependent methyltransferase [Spirochaetia bacterium]|nr:SAM-dependent methyltransferase [Spirochaetia bacterium]
MNKNTSKVEFGDFQTPTILAKLMISILFKNNINPNIIIEPTCGKGEILFCSIEHFKPECAIGVEINEEYAQFAKGRINGHKNINIHNDDIFSYLPHSNIKVEDDSEVLLIGNPPWVTNSALGAINSSNLPIKSNIKNLNGIEAITGKSNFDIAEYILMNLIDYFCKYKTYFAFLCKTIVARNILKSIWQKNISYCESSIYPIDSKIFFSAAVDACFFTIDFRKKEQRYDCNIYDSIESTSLQTTYGYYDGMIINDYVNFQSHNYFGKSEYIWRNGIKHDCSKVMELDYINGIMGNGFGEEVDIENDLLFPLLKSSDLQKNIRIIRKYVIVTQRYVGEDTTYIKYKYPKTWNYLLKYKSYLDARKSSIYKNKPLFSIFSIGDYSFCPFKIAISGLYKNIKFVVLSHIDNKPIMIDDTCNYIPCYSEEEATFLLEMLCSQEVDDFLKSVIFWDSKRPITTELLNKICLSKVAEKMNINFEYLNYVKKNKKTKKDDLYQMSMF